VKYIFSIRDGNENSKNIDAEMGDFEELVGYNHTEKDIVG
jgi:hypothetical protein